MADAGTSLGHIERAQLHFHDTTEEQKREHYDRIAEHISDLNASLEERELASVKELVIHQVHPGKIRTLTISDRMTAGFLQMRVKSSSPCISVQYS